MIVDFVFTAWIVWTKKTLNWTGSNNNIVLDYNTACYYVPTLCYFLISVNFDGALT